MIAVPSGFSPEDYLALERDRTRATARKSGEFLRLIGAERWGRRTSQGLRLRVRVGRFHASICHPIARSHIVRRGEAFAVCFLGSRLAGYSGDVLGSSSRTCHLIRGVVCDPGRRGATLSH